MDLIDSESRRWIPRSQELPGEPNRVIIEKSVSLGENIFVSWQSYIGHGLNYENEFLHFSILAKPAPKMSPFPIY